ncbi:MAG: haloacid dehalogenase type II [Chloroflexota bacterium]|nr:haloacid dehalogenase type II [Chloroflexota bacterium]
MTAVTVFDAYGTLFDPHGLTVRLEAAFPGLGAALSGSWREAQLRYTWLRSLMGQWAPFDAVTADALRWACERHGVTATPELADSMLDAYRVLPAYPDVAPALAALPGPLVILSNGSRPMLRAACDDAGVGDRFKVVLSSDDVHVYKPDPRIYGLVPDRLGVAANDVRFVSGNGWDCAGAAAFGFDVVHILRRAEPPERLGHETPPTIADLRDLA